jgi:cbb3-type cytochrome oxidase subunit 3
MVAVFLIILFAINYSIYRTNKKIAEDLQRIKEKLGLMTEEEQIEVDIKQGIEAEKDPIAMGKINAEIERELELELGHKEEDDRR